MADFRECFIRSAERENATEMSLRKPPMSIKMFSEKYTSAYPNILEH